jgi:hypothetical protein
MILDNYPVDITKRFAVKKYYMSVSLTHTDFEIVSETSSGHSRLLLEMIDLAD